MRRSLCDPSGAYGYGMRENTGKQPRLYQRSSGTGSGRGLCFRKRHHPGGDDGIAVAYALALLEDDSLCHPALEVLITVDEEIGLLGAAALDTTPLKGRYLINLDSEEEGYLWVGCAGGLTAQTNIPVKYQEADGRKYEITVSGLLEAIPDLRLIKTEQTRLCS